MDDVQNAVQAEEKPPVAANKVSEANTEEAVNPYSEEEAKTETSETDEEIASDDDEQDDADDSSEKPRRKSGIQRLKERNARLEERNARLDAELMEYRSRQRSESGNIQDAIAREIGLPPKESDFSDYLAYERAMTAWTVKAAIAEERIKERGTVAQQRQQERVRELAEALEDGKIEARMAIPDYDIVLKKAASVPVAPHVELQILESDKSALLLYHLAKRPETVDRLNAMHPVAAARELGRMEARLSLPNPDKTTKAPPPVKAVRGSAAVNDADAEIDAFLTKTYGKNRR